MTRVRLPRPVLRFPVDPPDSPIGVMYLFAVLAYPQHQEADKRDRMLLAVEAWYAKAAGTDDKWRRPRQQVDNQLSHAWRRIQRRLVAAELADRVMLRHDRLTGVPSRFVITDTLNSGTRDIGSLRIVIGQNAEANAGPPGAATITSVLNDHAECIKRYCGIDDSHLMRDVWSSSKSVLHLALSFRLDLERPFPGDGDRHKLLSMLANPHWIEDCLERAERWRTLFMPYSPLRIRPDEMIQVLPAKS